MATVTQVQEATNASGQPIKLAVAYDNEVHNQVVVTRRFARAVWLIRGLV
jgi:hypothetical protein